ncbi:CheY chemotaxis protein or a CheY-like REC (receiver) domain [Cnuella takakiae]|uniref:CheY chemotaxis protein or a CheY-like REC (Receiver) domain n=1 Tax=Cnuella takakiae TaxID=1302690 RepID=A0A1M4Z2W5_9BACT|nr:response regulator [Cnuella takakiae]OLY94347.1 hypothetical protein BUE76_22510 [Cnuella takakiae]SHF12391.1 CheY chemotaxis protein or a CheY-like REC (receiver) domain [Cnuella takakiae]
MSKRKILLAEDDEDDRLFFQDFLQSRNDVVLMPIVENGVLLVDLLKCIENDADLPDLIILDQNMPKQNGLQTLEFLKQDKRFNHIPIVIYSTYADENLIKNGFEKGACIVLPKPVTKEGYNEMVETVFKICV